MNKLLKISVLLTFMLSMAANAQDYPREMAEAFAKADAATASAPKGPAPFIGIPELCEGHEARKVREAGGVPVILSCQIEDYATIRQEVARLDGFVSTKKAVQQAQAQSVAGGHTGALLLYRAVSESGIPVHGPGELVQRINDAASRPSNLVKGYSALVDAASSVKASIPAHWEGGSIVLSVPEREAGQKTMLGFRAEPLDTVRVGIIGVGMRGRSAVKRYCQMDGARLTAICDLEQATLDRAQNIISGLGHAKVDEYCGEGAWKQICEREDINLVYICADWIKHTPMAVYAMEHGKHVAIEVPAATSLAECWQLVNTSEKTRRHCMMLENCCYDFFEMATLMMAQKGMFGEIVHLQGGYIHNLDPFWNSYHGNWRLEFNRTHRGDVYPTHGFGPLCQILGIHRGDKMDYMVAMDSKSFHGADVARKNMGAEEFADGDHTVSLIRTHSGRIIEIQHNVYASRPYSRLFQVTGTEGFASKYPQEQLSFCKTSIQDYESVIENYDNLSGEKPLSPEMTTRLKQDFLPDFVKQIQDKARKVGGHGGMDYIMDYRLVYCLRNGLPLDEDVYDAAEWSALVELSALSLDNGSAPVQYPDFTRGDWDLIQGFSYAY